MPLETSAPSRVGLIGFYVLVFAATGITLPYLPAYLKSLDLSATEVGVLLTIGPTLAMVVPSLWGQVADRTGRPDRVLTLLVVGSAAFFVPLLFVQRFAVLFGVLCVYGLFSTGISTLIDSLTLHHVALRGGSYARIRVFGSMGFVAASTAFGALVNRVDVTAVAVPLALLALAAAWSLTLTARVPSSGHAPSLLGALSLARSARLWPFLAAACIHWIACAPWNGSLAIHLAALHLPTYVVGLAAGMGVVAEIAAMLAYPRFADRVAPRHLLFVSFAASAARWAGMALTSDAATIVALSALHGLTFGTFYVASVAYVARRVPVSLRSSGQALFVSVAFGVGGLVGLLSGGAAYDAFGGRWLFGAAAVVELVAAAVALGLKPPTPAGLLAE